MVSTFEEPLPLRSGMSTNRHSQMASSNSLIFDSKDRPPSECLIYSYTSFYRSERLLLSNLYTPFYLLLCRRRISQSGEGSLAV